LFGRSVSISNNNILIGSPGDDDNGESSGSAYIFTSGNQPPNIPDINGPSNGKVGETIHISATSFDIDSDEIYYRFEWGDGTNSGWVGPYHNGVTAVEDHIWYQQDEYVIKVKAKDEKDAESDWGSFNITIPRSKQTGGPLSKILESYLSFFPNLKTFFEKLGLF